MRVFFWLLMGGYLLGNLYIFIRTWQGLADSPLMVKWMSVLIGVLFACSLPLVLWFRHAGLPPFWMRMGSFIGSVWLVFTLYMVLALLVVDVLRFCWPALHYGYFGALFCTILVLFYGYYVHLHPRVNQMTLPVNKPFDGGTMKIVAVSDVHLGYGTGKGRLQRFVEMINAQEPDIVLIVGDLVDNDITPLEQERMEEELSRLRAPWGVYMVPGNHEYISGIRSCMRFLQNTPVRLLRDTVITLPNGVQLVGRDDRSRRNRSSLVELLQQTDTERPIILLDHQPYELSKSDSLGVDLQFSGHTHHGQVWPVSLWVERMYEQSHGYRRWSHAHVYVSSGLSLWGPPFRIGTRGDMAVVLLENGGR